MTANITLLLLIGILVSTGTYLLLERNLTRILLGILLISNGVNLLLLLAGGPPGRPPIWNWLKPEGRADSDPLAQALILTAIVITMGLTAFVLALAYRSYEQARTETVEDDTEDQRIAERSPTDFLSAPDSDRSDDPITGDDTEAGDAFGPDTGEAPLRHRDDAPTEEGS